MPKFWGVVSGADDAAAKGAPFSWERVSASQPGYASRASRFVAELEAGDVLYLPAFWWHRVETLSDALAVNVWMLDRKTATDRKFHALRREWAERARATGGAQWRDSLWQTVGGRPVVERCAPDTPSIPPARGPRAAQSRSRTPEVGQTERLGFTLDKFMCRL